MKKLASLLLAMIMVFAMSMTAFAADADLSGHTYKAYQIFAGTQGEGSALGQIKWGTGVNATGLLTALKQGDNSIYATCATAADVAAQLTEENAKAFAKIAYNHIVPAEGVDVVSGVTELDAGYYLIVDVTEAPVEVYNLALLRLTEDKKVVIESKTDAPTVEKKVKDTNDSVANSTTDWQDSADHDINDDVPFQLKATLGDHVDDYDTYKVIFHDTLSAGLTYNNDAKYYIDGKEVTGFTVSTTNGLEFKCLDVKALGAKSGSVITVEYTAKLNANAVIGSAGNPNTVYLEYSNNPNQSGEGGNHPTGETPKDTVIVFTYKVVANKVTGNPDYNKEDETSKEYIELVGAGFTLYKKDIEAGDYVQIGNEVTGPEMTTFEWKGLDDGEYKLVETTVPAGYNKIADIIFTVTAEHDVTSDDPKLTALSGNGTSGEVSVTFAPDVEAGSLSTKVVNEKGALLPSTGGMGTTLFYVAGFAMMITAAGAFVARRRMTF